MATLEMGEKQPFQFERRIPLMLIFGLLLQTGAALFWAGSAAQRISDLEQQTQINAGAVERVVRLEEQVAALRDTLIRVETKIDRIATVQGK